MIPLRGTIEHIDNLWVVTLSYQPLKLRKVSFYNIEHALNYLRIRLSNEPYTYDTEGPRGPEEVGTSNSNSPGNSSTRITNERAGILPMDARN